MRALPGARIAVPLAILVAALAVRIEEPRVVTDLQLGVFDALQRQWPRVYESVPVRVVDLDDETLARTGQFPWPRTRVATLVDRLTELGAAVIVFDMVFAEPDRTSPEQVAANWPDGPGVAELRERILMLPDHDEALAAAFARSRVVAGFSLTSGDSGRSPATKAGHSWGGPDPTGFVHRLDGSVPNLPSIEEAAEGNGNFSLAETGNQVIRRLPLVFSHRGTLYPSLAAEAIRVAHGTSNHAIRSAGATGVRAFGEDSGITHVRVGKVTVPTDERGRAWIHYTPVVPERSVPAWRILEGDWDAALIRDHIVFIGTSAQGLSDLRPTPIHPTMAGVLLHAQMAEQILLGHFLERPDWSLAAELLFMLVLGLVLVAGQRGFGAMGEALLAVGVISAALVFSVYAYREWLWLLDPVYASLTVLLVYITGSFLNYRNTEAERRQIRDAFGHYLSPALVAQLAENPERLRLGGEQRPLTILFTDIRGFTTLSERIADAEQLTKLVNRFLTPMTEWILECGGTIDKYMGDCIMAFWNAPIDDPDHARHCCEAALGMLPRLDALNETLRSEALADGRTAEALRIGIGINTGECCVGNLGSDMRFDYSAIGDEVNLASRLEGQSKEYGVDVVIGENTRLAVPDIATLELDLIRVKGKAKAVAIHTLRGGADIAQSPEFSALSRHHAEMLGAYRARGWDAAQAAIDSCLRDAPDLVRLYTLYSERIVAMRANPPPKDWDGVHTAETK